MNCSLCSLRYAMAHPVPDRTGLYVPMCIECAAEHSKPPRRFPEGTQRNGRLPHNDFADDERATLGREVEMATAQRDALAHCLADLLRLFRRELAGGYSTAEAQAALRCARAMLAELGVGA